MKKIEKEIDERKFSLVPLGNPVGYLKQSDHYQQKLNNTKYNDKENDSK